VVAADFVDDVDSDFFSPEELDFSEEFDLSFDPDPLEPVPDPSELGVDVAEPLLELFVDSRLSVR